MYTKPHDLPFVVLIAIVALCFVSSCKSKEEKFAEAEAICFDAVSDLLEQEITAHHEACNGYDSFIRSHAQKIETMLPASSSAIIWITPETPLSIKDSWLEHTKYFYLTQFHLGSKSSAIRYLYNDYTTGMQTTRDRLAWLYKGRTIESKYDYLQTVWYDNDKHLLNGVKPERADSLRVLFRKAVGIYHFYHRYQPEDAYIIGAWTFEYADSIERANMRLNEYRHQYQK